MFLLSVCGIRLLEVIGGRSKIAWPGQKVISLWNKAATALSERARRGMVISIHSEFGLWITRLTASPSTIMLSRVELEASRDILVVRDNITK